MRGGWWARGLGGRGLSRRRFGLCGAALLVAVNNAVDVEVRDACVGSVDSNS